MSYTTKIVIKKDYQKQDQTYPLYLRLTINRKVKYYHLSQSIQLEHFDTKTGTANSKHLQRNRINNFLAKKKLKADDILIELDSNGKNINHKSFQAIWESDASDKDFHRFAKKQIKQMKGQFTDEYIRHLETYLKKIDEYNPNLSFQDITPTFLSDLEYHLRNKYSNKQNTIHSNLKFIRNIVNRAIEQEIISTSPFARFKLKKEKTAREYLNKDELLKVEQLLDYNIPFYLKNITVWFLLSCYTGWRYKDVKNIDEWHIYNDSAMLRMHKSGKKKEVTIYFNGRIRRVMSLINSGIYQLPSNQKCNTYLKEIITLAGIKKKITFHCARHTFATINGILGNNIAITSAMLGHESINSTQIYQRADEASVKRALHKWDNF